jgi:mercuric ion transport protein
MNNRTLLGTGIAGSVIAAVCCATPILVILLGAIGLSAWVGRLDYAERNRFFLGAGLVLQAGHRDVRAFTRERFGHGASDARV